MVATLEALTPVPTVGVPEARTGGQLVAQAPKHVLLGPESFLNRYTVRPCASTRMFPRLPLATSTVAGASPEVPGDLDEVGGAGCGGRGGGGRPPRRRRPARRRPARRPRPPSAESFDW